jgi:sulfopyruvate decarboxylase subunit beta
MRRLEALKAIAEATTPADLLTTSLGATPDDWWNVKAADNALYLTALGSVTSIALGMAVSLPHRRIVALDSDGSMLMNTGIMCTLGAERPNNLTVVVMDNGIYESIGGPITHTSRNTDLAKMAEGAGCVNCATVQALPDLQATFRRMLEDDQMGFLVAKIEAYAHPWKPEERKPTDGVEDKYKFIRYVEKLENVVIHGGRRL